jgi:hypothetical protein
MTATRYRSLSDAQLAAEVERLEAGLDHLDRLGYYPGAATRRWALVDALDALRCEQERRQA